MINRWLAIRDSGDFSLRVVDLTNEKKRRAAEADCSQLTEEAPSSSVSPPLVSCGNFKSQSRTDLWPTVFDQLTRFRFVRRFMNLFHSLDQRGIIISIIYFKASTALSYPSVQIPSRGITNGFRVTSFPGIIIIPRGRPTKSPLSLDGQKVDGCNFPPVVGDSTLNPPPKILNYVWMSEWQRGESLYICCVAQIHLTERITCGGGDYPTGTHKLKWRAYQVTCNIHQGWDRREGEGGGEGGNSSTSRFIVESWFNLKDPKGNLSFDSLPIKVHWLLFC